MDDNLLRVLTSLELTEKVSFWFSPAVVADLLLRAGLALVIVLIALLINKIGARMIKRLFAPGNKKEFFSEELRKILKLGFTTLWGYGVVLIAATFILELFRVKVFGPDQLRLVGIITIKVIGIIILGQLALTFGGGVIEHLFKQNDQEEEEEEQLLVERRARTLGGLLKSTLRYGVYFVAGVMILDSLGVRTASILAGAGIIGLAVGFGAQNLVRDIITGFFIIFEDQYSVGDFVTVADVTGTVEDLGLRTTKVRAWTGQLHIIPNGEVGKVTNFNTGKMAALVTVSIAYEEDIDRAVEVLTDAGLRARGEFPQIIEDPEVQGVTELGDSEVMLRVIAFTKPGEQWSMERELRKRFKQALDQAGIEIPYPRRVIITTQKSEVRSQG